MSGKQIWDWRTSEKGLGREKGEREELTKPIRRSDRSRHGEVDPTIN